MKPGGCVWRANNPLFMESEYRLAHYALTGGMAVEVYGLAPTYVMDGLESRYHFVIAGWRAEGLTVACTLTTSRRGRATARGSTFIQYAISCTLTLSAAQGAWSFKAGYNTNHATFIEPRTEMLFGVLQSMQAGGLAMT